MDICLNAISFFTLSYITQNAQRSGNCRQETDGDLKNGLPSFCFHLALFLRLVDTWFSLIDFKEVGVHGTHGNAVVNHTFLCFDGWYFNSLRAPFLAIIVVIIDDRRLSSMTTDIWYKRSFLSIAGAKVQQFWVGNKFLGYRFFCCVCKCLTDSTLQRYLGNQLLHFDRIGRKWRLVTQNFRKAVISGHFHFQFSSSHATIHGHNEFSDKACPCFDVKKKLDSYFVKGCEK